MANNKLPIKLIKKYQSNTSRTPKCRHYPSCSNYSLECYQKFNFFKATFLTIYRILRCNPLSKNIYDPVPFSKQEKKDYNLKLEAVSYIDDNLISIYNKLNNIDYLIEYVLTTDNNIEGFYYKIDRILILVKNKKINLPYKKTKKYINNYLLNIYPDSPFGKKKV